MSRWRLFFQSKQRSSFFITSFLIILILGIIGWYIINPKCCSFSWNTQSHTEVNRFTGSVENPPLANLFSLSPLSFVINVFDKIQQHLFNDRLEISSCYPAFEQMNRINDQLREYLVPLLDCLYFRYVRIDLAKPCLFFENESMCSENECPVSSSPFKRPSSPTSYKNISLGNIKFPTLKKEGAFMDTWEDNSIDFSLVNEESNSVGVFVDLSENEERYTGYSGDPAHRIWAAIYSENCFDPYISPRVGDHSKGNATIKESPPLPDASLLSNRPHINPFEEPKHTCPESSLFYRLISGFHASVSMHICYKYLDPVKGAFRPNTSCFTERLGKHRNRIASMYTTYMVLLRALQKASNYLSQYTIETGKLYEDQKAKDLIQLTSSLTIACHNLFNERSVFQGGEASAALKRDFRRHFRNISRIMDCVGCQKCRLWGKIQIMGIGTALKILFSFEDHHPDGESIQSTDMSLDYRLTKTEIVALMNTIGKFSDSILFHNKFQERIAKLEKKKMRTLSFYTSWASFSFWVKCGLRFFFLCFLFLCLYIWRRRRSTRSLSDLLTKNLSRSRLSPPDVVQSVIK